MLCSEVAFEHNPLPLVITLFWPYGCYHKSKSLDYPVHPYKGGRRKENNKDIPEFKGLYVEKECVCELIKFKLEYVERENRFPIYIPSASILNTDSISFMVCIFNRDLFCELNLAGVFSGTYLSSINNSISNLIVLFFPCVGPVKQCDW